MECNVKLPNASPFQEKVRTLLHSRVVCDGINVINMTFYNKSKKFKWLIICYALHSFIYLILERNYKRIPGGGLFSTDTDTAKTRANATDTSVRL